MGKWRECKLAEAPLEILDGDRGKNYPSQDEFMTNGHCLFLSTKNVRIDGFDFSECQFISKERDELLRKGKLERDDLVLTTRGTVGNLGFYKSSVNYDNVRINSGMVIIRPMKDELLPRFNYYLFRKLQNDFHTFTSGSAQPQLPIRDLKEVEVSIPPLPEQKAIASVLSSLDDKIDLLHRQNKTLEAMAETLFRQWFVEEAKDDWEEMPLSSIAEHKKINIRPDQNPEVLYNHYSIPAFDNGKHPVKELGSEIKSNKYQVIANSILISKLNPRFPRVWAIGNLLDYNSICSTEFQVIFPLKAEYFSFIYFFLISKPVADELTGAAGGTSGSHQRVKPEDIFNLKFQMPAKQKIDDFNSIISENWKRITNNMLQIHTLEKLRDTLLPKLMSGEVRVAYDH